MNKIITNVISGNVSKERHAMMAPRRKLSFEDIVFLVAVLCADLTLISATTGEKHRTFQYNKPADEAGTYNFAYDTGSKDAHSMRMEHRDNEGIIRGRYGYTDPHGKLRMVEYEAGPEGFKARGDVGPDLSLHDVVPGKPTNLQLVGWDPVNDPIDAHGRRLEPVIAVPYTEDHPVKGYQAPIPIVQKTQPIVAMPISDDHTTKGQPVPVPIVQQQHEDVVFVEPAKSVVAPHSVKHPVPPAPIKTIPKSVALVAPLTADHPEKGHQAPVRIIEDSHVHAPQKTIDYVAPARVIDHPVKGDPHPIARVITSPPKSVAVVAPIRLDHPEKGHQAPVRIVQEPHVHPHQKSIDIVVPAKVIDHRVKGDPHVVARVVEAPQKSVAVVAPIRVDHPDKGISHAQVVAKPVKSYHVDKVIVPPPKYQKSVMVDHPEKGYDVPRHVKAAAMAVDRHVDVFEPLPKSVALVAPVKVEPHVDRVYRADHSVKGYVAPQRMVQKHDHLLERVHSPPKSVSVVAPIVDHRTKGYVARTQPLVYKSARQDDHHHHVEKVHSPQVKSSVKGYSGAVVSRKYSDGHQHVENIYGPWISPSDHSYRPPKPLAVVSKGVTDHHHHREAPLGYYAVSSGKQRHYHTVGGGHSTRSHPIKEVEVDDRHSHYVRSKDKDHNHPTFQTIKTKNYHDHDHNNMAVVDRHSEVTMTDKHGRIVDHYHQRLEPLTIRNIDVDPNEIRVAASPSQHYHAASDRNTVVRVVTDVPVDTSEVRVRGRSVVTRSASSSVETGHADSGPRKVSFVPGNRHGPGTFVFE